MVLVIDVGNTNTMLGLLDEQRIVQTWRISTVARTTDELGGLLLQLLANRGAGPSDVDGAICCCVVPSLVYTVEKACLRYLSVECLRVGRGIKTGMPIHTDNPREVGADRIVNAVAAIERGGGPVIVVDFGTATTFDCVDARHAYVGGVIAPGLRISEEALFDRTAQLPRVELQRPPSVIGRNTVNAVQSGLFYGYAGLVDSVVDRIRGELGADARVVATGGYANLLATVSERIEEVDVYLTLRGLGVLHARNR
ncbi:MAG TPA: type III pantothenate kinase [Deltaproteobacteria bacterium]|nr:type III pantothenate kinase [Deltaproteobacteria bacterium]